MQRARSIYFGVFCLFCAPSTLFRFQFLVADLLLQKIVEVGELCVIVKHLVYYRFSIYLFANDLRGRHHHRLYRCLLGVVDGLVFLEVAVDVVLQLWPVLSKKRAAWSWLYFNTRGSTIVVVADAAIADPTI